MVDQTILMALLASLSLTLVAIPPLMRLAPRVGLVDIPDARKVHLTIIPRCGGVGLGLAALVTISIFGGGDHFTKAYIVATIILLGFGIWDDRAALDYRLKFFGQIVAVLVMMAMGNVLHHLPFFGIAAPPQILCLAVTFVFILGAVNALNLFDGLDGLAGGCALLSLAALAIVASASHDGAVPLIALTVIGGILGFLRFNTWPAMIFMGDAGSQLLGFSVAVLAIHMVETANNTISSAIILPILGLPVIDTLMVFSQRLMAGKSPFKPDKNHTHHKLLAIGFKHYEAVSLIYLCHTALVVGAVLLRFERDSVVLGIYGATILFVIGGLALARHYHWQVRSPENAAAPIDRRRYWLRERTWIGKLAIVTLGLVMSGYIFTGPLYEGEASVKIAPFAFASLGVAAVAIIAAPRWRRFTFHGLTYFATGLATLALVTASFENDMARAGLWGFFILALPAFIFAILTTRQALFRVTPQDILVVSITLALPILPTSMIAGAALGKIAFIGIFAFYIAEFLIQRNGAARRLIGGAAIASLFVIALRGLVEI